MTGDAVSEIQATLRGVAREYGFPHARISAFPMVLIVGLKADKPAGIRTIDSFAQLRLDQASDVIRLARAAESAQVPPSDAMTKLRRILHAGPRFGLAASIASHAVLTVGLGLVIRPAPIDLWVYAALGDGGRIGGASQRGSGQAATSWRSCRPRWSLPSRSSRSEATRPRPCV
jgi:uncharacterized membrane protein YjjP (DUF1212 family)